MAYFSVAPIFQHYFYYFSSHFGLEEQRRIHLFSKALKKKSIVLLWFTTFIISIITSSLILAKAGEGDIYDKYLLSLYKRTWGSESKVTS